MLRRKTFGVRVAQGIVALCFAISFFAPARPAPVAAPAFQVMSWGPIGRDWQRTLHITGMRMGCSGEPSACISAIDPGGPASVVLSILFKANTIGYGQQYSALSLAQPALSEISFDDFISQYQKIAEEHVDPVASLNSFIDGVKSRNHLLRFGATIYEDELGDLSDRRLPAATRARFDTVQGGRIRSAPGMLSRLESSPEASLL